MTHIDASGCDAVALSEASLGEAGLSTLSGKVRSIMSAWHIKTCRERQASESSMSMSSHRVVEWTANRRMKAIGLKPVYDIAAKNNPLPWTQHWISSKGLQVAPQETEVESYVVGGIKQDVKKDTFSGFKL